MKRFNVTWWRERCLLKLLVAALLLGVGSSPASAQSAFQDTAPEKGRFGTPTLGKTFLEPPPGCDRARKRAAQILEEIEREIPARMKEAFRMAAQDLEPGESAAEG